MVQSKNRRFARPQQRLASATACRYLRWTSSDLDNGFIQQKWYYPDVENAFFISPRPLVAAGNDYLLEEISCHPQRTQFLVHLVIAAHVERTLQIVDFYAFLKRLYYTINSALTCWQITWRGQRLWAKGAKAAQSKISGFTRPQQRLSARNFYRFFNDEMLLSMRLPENGSTTIIAHSCGIESRQPLYHFLGSTAKAYQRIDKIHLAIIS